MDLIWIRSRDGSPTLWNNSLAESYRSIKGAYTESWAAFVGPGIRKALELKKEKKSIVVGEFGLGMGCNWVLWSLAAKSLGIEYSYFSIEKDTSAFLVGQKKWIEEATALKGFAAQSLTALLDDSNSAKDWEEALSKLSNDKIPPPTILPSIETPAVAKADLWFHDPFGAEVNPDGYTLETLKHCQKHWAKPCYGFSYACNRVFQRNLEELEGVSAQSIKSQSPLLKREHLCFVHATAEKPD